MLNRMSDSHLIHTSLPITPEMFARSKEGDLPLEEAWRAI
jgi:hypothetical protein